MNDKTKYRLGTGWALNDFVLGLLPFVVVLLLWELLGRADLEALRYVIPSPEAVLGALWHDFSSGEILRHTSTTMQEVFAGLLIAGFAAFMVGTAVGLSPLLDRVFYPMIIFFQAVPKVALAPLWLIAFGYGLGSKVALAAMVSFFPMLIGVVVGMKATRADEYELMRLLRASPWQVFWKVRLPRAIPSMFGGMEVGVIFALVGAVVGEFVGARSGLGYLIEFRSARLDLPGIFSPLIVLSLIGVAMDLGIKSLGKRLMAWEDNGG